MAINALRLDKNENSCSLQIITLDTVVKATKSIYFPGSSLKRVPGVLEYRLRFSNGCDKVAILWKSKKYSKTKQMDESKLYFNI